MTVGSVETLSALERRSLADGVYETLLEAIVNGSLAAGGTLSAVTLARQLGVSRTPVTEALQRLMHDGLVEQVPNHQPRVVRPVAQDVRDIYAVRAELEAAAAQRAAQYIDDETLASLRRQVDHLNATRDALDWPARALEFDLAFHATLAEASGNRRLAADIARYRRLVRCFCRMTGDRPQLGAALDEHEAILRAIEARQPDEARRAMTSHIAARLNVVLAQLFDSKAGANA